MRMLAATLAAVTFCACGTTSTSDAGTSTSGGVGTTSGGSTGGSSTGGTTGGTGGPITGLPTEQWTWVPVAGAICRDGSPTGIGVSFNPASTKMMIFLEGGGACFNVATCAENDDTVPYGASEFQSDFGPGGDEATVGIFNRGDPANPVADWTFVYVPYCTGDIHAGATPDGGTADGVGPEAFVGYHNIALDLARLVPTFGNLTEILLTGVSAGGFGALLNYDQVAAAFPNVPVELLDDSGPPMATGTPSYPYLAACLQAEVEQAWNFQGSVLPDCGADCEGDAGFALPYLQHVVGSHADRAFGLVDDTADSVISEFFGFGLGDCGGGNPLPPEEFDAGLMNIRAEMAAYPNFGLFAFIGTDHTSLEGPTFDTRTATDGGLPLTTWTADIVDGGVVNAGP